MATASYINSDCTFNRSAIMSAAWASARAMIVPPRPIRGFKPMPRPTLRAAFKQALRRIWDLARGELACARHRVEMDALSAPERIVVALRQDFLCASMIDSLPAMIAEQVAVQARAAALGVSL